jgi:hypothetical protein
MSQHITLTTGKTVQVDDDDFERLSPYRWTETNGYAITKINRKNVYMHRLLTNAPTGLDVDHINRDKLDNRKSNLRICTHQQNRYNSRKSTCFSWKTAHPQYKGVRRNRSGGWDAFTRSEGRYKHLGSFPTPEQAARAYDADSKGRFGEFASINFND